MDAVEYQLRKGLDRHYRMLEELLDLIEQIIGTVQNEQERERLDTMLNNIRYGE